MEHPRNPGPEEYPNIGSPSWEQGYKDGWDKKPCADPNDVSYVDGHQVGDAEREGGIDREGRLPVERWLENDLTPPSDIYPEYYEPPSDWNNI